MKKKIIFITFLASLILLHSCVNSPNSIDNNQKKKLRYVFPTVSAVNYLESYKDGSKFVQMVLSIKNKKIECYGKFSPSLVSSVKNIKRLSKIKLERTEKGILVIKSISTDLGIYGSLQYFLGYSWLSKFLPYILAYVLSLLIPITIFILILIISGFIFAEFEF